MPRKNTGDIGFNYDFYTKTLRFDRYLNEFIADSVIFIDIVLYYTPHLPHYLFTLNHFNPFSVIRAPFLPFFTSINLFAAISCSKSRTSFSPTI